MKMMPKLAVAALAAALAVPAYAQLGLPGMKQKEVEKLSKSDISKELVFKKGDIDKCRDEHKKKEPKVTGTLAARFTVQPSGSTSDIIMVSSQFKGTTFASCLGEKIRGWSFSKAKEKSAPYELVQTF